MHRPPPAQAFILLAVSVTLVSIVRFDAIFREQSERRRNQMVSPAIHKFNQYLGKKLLNDNQVLIGQRSVWIQGEQPSKNFQISEEDSAVKKTLLQRFRSSNGYLPQAFLNMSLSHHSAFERKLQSSRPAYNLDANGLTSRLRQDFLVKKEERVAVCFFGQVKNYKHVADSVQRHVFDVLDKTGLAYDVFAHTFNQSDFTNPRNREQHLPIDPASLQDNLAIPPTAMLYDNLAAADSAYNLTALLARGDPWPDNPRLSLRYYARQLHSLHRVTSLWEARAARYSWVLYLRPDLRFLSDLDLPRLRAFLHHAPDQAAIATPGFAKWGGLNDRLAFGPPSAMLAYGRRGEALERYVAVTQRRPCAEAYLAHYLAGHGVTAVDSEVRFQRIRADGRPDRRDAWLAAGPSGAPAPQPPESLMPVAHCQ